MSSTNRYVSKRIAAVIYKLKRLYGGTIQLYKHGTATTNLETGEKTWTGRETVLINRAIILPVKLERTQAQNISIISSGKEFVYGGMYDKNSRWFYIDPADLSAGYEIKRDDWIVYQGKKYEIKDIGDTEFDAMWEVLGVELPGVVPEQIHLLSGYTVVEITQSSSEVVE